MISLDRMRGLALPAVLVVVAGLLCAAVAVLGGPSALTAGSADLPQEDPTGTEVPTDAPLALDAVRVSSYEVFLARDPFEPLRPAAAQDTATDAPTTSPTEVPTTSPTDAPTDAPTPAPTPTGDGCTQGSAVVCDGLTIALVDVFEDGEGAAAVVQVNSELYEVRAGETFATSFRVQSVEPPCATLLYGDDMFTLCEGEQILK